MCHGHNALKAQRKTKVFTGILGLNEPEIAVHTYVRMFVLCMCGYVHSSMCVSNKDI